MYKNKDRLVIVDADGTLIDAFSAVRVAFARHGMDLGDLDRFQKRRHLFKYLGGIKEFPRNLAKHVGKHKRRELLATLTEVYRDEARLYPGMAELLRQLVETAGIRVGMVTRNVCHDPEATLGRLLRRHDLDADRLDFLHCLSLGEDKGPYFAAIRERLGINPARAYACGDEHKDYAAALAAGIQPFIVSYGFESHARLTGKFAIPEVIVARTPEELGVRLRHALDLG